MIIALTGHTKGLGAELYKDLTHQYKVIGMKEFQELVEFSCLLLKTILLNQ